MLKTRVITASVLVFGLLLAFYCLDSLALAALFIVVMAIAAWEWASISNVDSPLIKLAYTTLMMAVLLLFGYLFGLPRHVELSGIKLIVGFAGVAWLIAFLLVKTYPRSAGLWRFTLLRLLLGMLVLVPAWSALVFLLFLNNGSWLLLLLLAIVSFADTGAYFTGKAFGKHKLAPTVSPGKTWEGVLGGLFFVILLMLALSAYLPITVKELPWFAALLILPAMFSVVGDLFESMFKRSSGIKDSGKILPGHGGVLDRIDGFVAALPIFVLIYSFNGVSL